MGFLTDLKVLPYGLPVSIINIWEKKFQFIVTLEFWKLQKFQIPKSTRKVLQSLIVPHRGKQFSKTYVKYVSVTHRLICRLFFKN